MASSHHHHRAGKRRPPQPRGREAPLPKKKRQTTEEPDEEIDSSSDASLEDAVADADSSDEAKGAAESSGDEGGGDDDDTVEAQRLQLMRKYMKAAGLEDKEEEYVVDFLQKEAARAQKKVMYRTGNYLSSRSKECDDLAATTAITFHRGHKEPPTCLALSPQNRNHAFTGGKDKTLIMWDLETGAKLATGRPGKEAKATAGGHLRAILCVAVTADSRTVATGGCDHLIKLWDPRDMSACTNTLFDHVDAVTGIAADPLDHTRIYSIGGVRDMELRAWNLASPDSRPLKFFGHTEKACCLDILTPGRPLSGGEDSTVRLWRVERDTHLLYDWHKRPVDACTALSATRYVSGAQDNHLALWSVASRKPLATFENAHGSTNSGGGITALDKLPFSDFFVSGSNDGFLKAWAALDELPQDGNRKKMRHSIVPLFKLPVPGYINAVKITPDGALCVVAGGKEPRLGKWDSIRTAANGIHVIPLRLPLETSASLPSE